jgi:DivIVA domain-containing protein
VDRDSIDRIRSATFPVARRGYEKREVDRFLNKLAEWLETGGGDQARAELVRRELERIGQQTGKILTDAHDLGEQLYAEAEREAQRIVQEAQGRAAQTIAEAKAEAKRIVDEANQRRAEIEAVI